MKYVKNYVKIDSRAENKRAHGNNQQKDKHFEAAS